MTRLGLVLPSIAFSGALLCAGAAVAQFLGGDDAPRPPGSVPVRPQAPPQYAPAPPQYTPQYTPYPQQPYPQQPYPQQPYPQQPQFAPRQGGIQGEDLPAPAGAPPGVVQPAAVPPPGQQQPAAPAPGQPPGQPPGQSPGQPPAAAAPAPASPQADVVIAPPPKRIANPTAVFSGLDKITGRITSFEEAIGETVQFGALQVTTRACYSRPPTETPLTDGFVEVDEVTLQGAVRRIFTGWMFAASPGLHAVEHAVYDVWLVDCKGGAHQAAAEPQSAASPPRQQPSQQRQGRQQRQQPR